jgi:hypothetical protein
VIVIDRSAGDCGHTLGHAGAVTYDPLQGQLPEQPNPSAYPSPQGYPPAQQGYPAPQGYPPAQQYPPGGPSQYGPAYPPAAPPMPAAPPGYPPAYPSVPGYGAPPPLPVKKRSTAKVVGLVVALIVVLCLFGIIVAVIATSSPNTTAGATQADTTHPAANPAAAIVAWRDGGGLALMNRLIADFSDAGNAGQNADVAGLNAACKHLQTDVEAAQAYKPIPDPQAQTAWAAALAYFARSATDCVSGTDNLDVGLITKASNEMTQGSTQLRLVTTRIRQLSG